MYGTVELGGTKTDFAVGTSADDLTDRQRVETTDPSSTVAAIVDFFSDAEVDSVGVSSFGPLQLKSSGEGFGSMLDTPKPGWSHYPLYEAVSRGVGVPVGIDTDVNGAALGEGRWGAARGLSDYAYVTVGTGIGVGIVANGRLVGGSAHPEGGHIRVERIAGDQYPGRCPFHGACLEGMASGPAIIDRYGSPKEWGDDAVRTAAAYIAQGVAALCYITAPHRIVIGGGVSEAESFHRSVRDQSAKYLADYPVERDLDDLITAPGLGKLSGLAGGLILAEMALSQDPPPPM